MQATTDCINTAILISYISYLLINYTTVYSLDVMRNRTEKLYRILGMHFCEVSREDIFFFKKEGKNSYFGQQKDTSMGCTKTNGVYPCVVS
jgi:hypothetical protein